VRNADRLQVEGADIDDTLLEGDGQQGSETPLDSQFSGDVRAFVSITGFSPADFEVLSEPLDVILSVRRRGRHPVIGPMDSFLLFLHWITHGKLLREDRGRIPHRTGDSSQRHARGCDGHPQTAGGEIHSDGRACPVCCPGRSPRL
jgi:hypothetical protein